MNNTILTDAIFEEQKKRVEKIFYDWRDLIGLNTHRFNLLYDRSYDSDNAGTVAQISPNWQYLNHTVTFFMPKIMESDDNEHLEECILHELVHVLLNPIFGDAGDKSDAEVEKNEFATTNVTNALIWARNEGREKEKE